VTKGALRQPRKLCTKKRMTALNSETKSAFKGVCPENPALSIEQGRPTKRNRRDLEKAKQVGWNDRWSASLDPE
jgi:hypothetical protein